MKIYQTTKKVYWLILLFILGMSVVLYVYQGTDKQNLTDESKKNPFSSEELYAKGEFEKPEPVSSAPSMDIAIEGLENRLKEMPDDADGWALLGRSYQFIGQNEKATDALQKAIDLGNKDQSTIDALSEVKNDGSEKNHEIEFYLKKTLPTLSEDSEIQSSKSDELVAKDTKDFTAWIEIGRSFQKEKRFNQAIHAFEKALALKQDDPIILTDLADVLAASNDLQITGRPMKLIESALAIDPENTKALWLAGTGELQQGNKDKALTYWKKLHALLPTGSEDEAIIKLNIRELEEGGTLKDEQITHPLQVKGKVMLDDRYSGDVNDEDTVFVFARAVEGPRMPLAIVRKQVKDLPFTFSFDDSMSMSPEIKLSSFPEVIIIARISRSGSAMPASGDIKGESEIVDINDTSMHNIIINSLIDRHAQ